MIYLFDESFSGLCIYFCCTVCNHPTHNKFMQTQTDRQTFVHKNSYTKSVDRVCQNARCNTTFNQPSITCNGLCMCNWLAFEHFWYNTTTNGFWNTKDFTTAFTVHFDFRLSVRSAQYTSSSPHTAIANSILPHWNSTWQIWPEIRRKTSKQQIQIRFHGIMFVRVYLGSSKEFARNSNGEFEEVAKC